MLLLLTLSRHLPTGRVQHPYARFRYEDNETKYPGDEVALSHGLGRMRLNVTFNHISRALPVFDRVPISLKWDMWYSEFLEIRHCV